MRKRLVLTALIGITICLTLSAQLDLQRSEKSLTELKTDLHDKQNDHEMLEELLTQETAQIKAEVAETYKPPVIPQNTLKTQNLPSGGKVEQTIIKYCDKYDVDPNVPLKIAYAESRYNPDARNKSSSAKGVYQFIDSSWKSYSQKAGRGGESVLNADANIETAIWTIKHYGTNPWNASRSKWSK
jgi:soluble lytic murein transglycosylase-like protein